MAEIPTFHIQRHNLKDAINLASMPHMIALPHNDS